jgi:hypothetical protein
MGNLSEEKICPYKLNDKTGNNVFKYDAGFGDELLCDNKDCPYSLGRYLIDGEYPFVGVCKINGQEDDSLLKKIISGIISDVIIYKKRDQ